MADGMQATSVPVIHDLFWLFFWPALAVALFAFAWLGVALVRFRDRPGRPEPEDAPVAGRAPPERSNRYVLAAFVVVPLAIVLALDVVDQEALHFLKEVPPGDHLTVQVEAFQWGWEFIYPDGLRTRDELRVPLGRPVVLKLTSRDVLHAFYVPAFGLKQDAVPGQISTLWFQATEPGIYRAQCAEYCGLAHSKMISTVVAMEPAEFERWRAEQARGAA